MLKNLFNKKPSSPKDSSPDDSDSKAPSSDSKAPSKIVIKSRAKAKDSSSYDGPQEEMSRRDSASLQQAKKTVEAFRQKIISLEESVNQSRQETLDAHQENSVLQTEKQKLQEDHEAQTLLAEARKKEIQKLQKARDQLVAQLSQASERAPSSDDLRWKALEEERDNAIEDYQQALQEIKLLKGQLSQGSKELQVTQAELRLSSQKLKDTHKEISKSSQKINILETKICELNNLESAYHEKEKAWKGKLQVLEQKWKTQHAKAQKLDQENQQLKEEFHEYQQKVKEDLSRNQYCKDKYKTIKSELKQAEDQIAHLMQQALETSPMVQSAQESIQELTQKLQETQDSLLHQQKYYESEIESLQKEHQAQLQESQSQEQEDQHREAKKELQELNNSYRELQKENGDLRRQIELTRTKLHDLEGSHIDTLRKEEIASIIAGEATQTIQKLQERQRQLEDQISQAHKQHQVLQTTNEKLQRVILELQTQSSQPESQPVVEMIFIEIRIEHLDQEFEVELSNQVTTADILQELREADLL